eukprot:3436199-Rhodomonas_salina.1
MSGTNLAYGATQRPAYACYAMSGTDLGYGGMRCPVLYYAMSGTDLGYGAMPGLDNSIHLDPIDDVR